MINSPISILLVIVLFASCNQKRNTESSSINEKSDSTDKSVELIRDDDEKKVNIFINGDFFTSYLYPETLKKPVLYPVKTAGGVIVTRGFPLDPRPGERTDHPHHVGLWFNYGDVNGLDFWNNSESIPVDERNNYGTIFHKGINSISSGDGKGELEVIMDWVDSEENVLLKEKTTFIFRGTDNKRMIDRITKLTALDTDVSMKDNKEGMLGLRMASELEHPGENAAATGIYKSSEGREGTAVWGTRGKWMNLAGEVGGEKVSVAILDHPDNIGYPTYWHARGYGLFAANPLGQKAMSDGKEELNFKLPAGESVTFKHRIVIYSDQEASDEQINKDWGEFGR